VNDYLRFLLPILELAMPHLCLRASYLLVRNKCSRIPRLLVLSVLYLMDLENPSSLSNDSNGHPVSSIADAPKGPVPPNMFHMSY
jgi:hypothetical protein